MLKNTKKFGIITAIISFIIGTIFLITYLVSRKLTIAVNGYFYLIIAFIINLIIAIFYTIQAQIHSEKRKKYYKTVLIMLINIPVALIYFLIVNQIV